jgi:hypothetical protein
METHSIEGKRPFKSVRVQYDFDPLEKRYRGLAIVIDTALEEGATYSFDTPLVKTKERALQMAEHRLSNLSMGLPPEGVPLVLNLDLPIVEFRKQLAQWDNALQRQEKPAPA